MQNENIILIGPMGVGKTSVAKALSGRLHMAYVDVDELRWAYFEKMPEYNHSCIEALFSRGDEESAFAYMKPFEARLVPRLLEDHPQGVIDFGAGYTVYRDRSLFESVRLALEPYEHVVLLRYSADPDESLLALQARHPDVPAELYAMLNREFIQSLCNEMLARHIVYTKGLTIDSVVDAVLSELGL